MSCSIEFLLKAASLCLIVTIFFFKPKNIWSSQNKMAVSLYLKAFKLPFATPKEFHYLSVLSTILLA